MWHKIRLTIRKQQSKSYGSHTYPITFNLFHVIGFCLYPLKTLENQTFSDFFQELQKETVA